MTSSSPELVYPSLELADHPYPFYELLRADAPVYRVPGRDEYLVARHEDVVHVLKHPEVYSNALARQGRKHSSGSHEESGADASTIASDPPEHKEKRALCFRGFTPGRLKTYEPRVRAIVDDLIDGFAGRGEVEFVSEFANPLPILVFCALFFGDAREDFDRFRRWALLEGSADPELVRDRRDRRPLRRIVRHHLRDHPHRTLPQLRRVGTRSTSHDSILLNRWSLRTSRGGSIPDVGTTGRSG